MFLSVATVFACATALARVAVVPRYQTVKSFSRITLKALVNDQLDETVTWSFPGRDDLQAPGGLLLAPAVQEGTLITVRASKDGQTGEGTLLVLPQSEIAAVLTQAMVGELDAKWSNRLPFLDVETGARFGGAAEVRAEQARTGGAPLLGFGIPGTVGWSRELATADALLLTWRDGRDVERLEVTDRSAVSLILRDWPQTCQVEGLWRKPATDGRVAWESRTETIDLRVRGAVPFAGNGVAEGGHEDGQGISARFRAPSGAALWLRARNQPETFAVADAVDQTIRLVSLEGAVTTLCGEPGQAGRQDGEGAAARFDRPSFVVAPGEPLHPDRKIPGDLVVADTGNQVLRRVDAQGRVTTWAGQPGAKGWKDAENPLEAAFNEPRGLAYDHQGNLFVADSGNHVLRRISPQGAVTTVAGEAGEDGTDDGIGAEARFTDLKGLAFDLARQWLLIADGHAIRSYSLETGEVATLAGEVRAHGFRDGEDLANLACLKDPWGLDFDPEERRLLIADRGNHAVRSLEHRGQEDHLLTLAGDPAVPETRWGLLRDGFRDFLPRECAALEGPITVAAVPRVLFPGSDHILVGTSRSLGLLARINRSYDHPAPSAPSLALEEGQTLKAGQPLRLTHLGLFAEDGTEPAQGVPHAFTYHFLDPASRTPVLNPIQGRHGFGVKREAVEVAFTQPGEVRVVVQCVTATGTLYSDSKTLVVAP